MRRPTALITQVGSIMIRCVAPQSTPNHAVTAAGYFPEAIIIKNSYGITVGIDGYALFKRGWHGCGLYRYTLTVTLADDSEEVEE